MSVYDPWMGVLPVRAQHVPAQGPMYLHDHAPYWEIAVVTSGTAVHSFGNTSSKLERGHVVFIPSGWFHGYSEAKHFSVFNFLFDPARLALPLHQLANLPGYVDLTNPDSQFYSDQARPGAFQVEPATLDRLLARFADLEAERAADRDGFEIYVLGLCAQIWVDLSRDYARIRCAPDPHLTRLRPLLQWIRSHLAEPLPVPRLAHQAGLSEKTLTRYFQKALKKSPIHHVAELRVREAQYLLRTTSVRVSKVAARVGVDDPAYFARLFKKHTGYDPSAYRQLHRVEHAFRDGNTSDP